MATKSGNDRHAGPRRRPTVRDSIDRLKALHADGKRLAEAFPAGDGVEPGRPPARATYTDPGTFKSLAAKAGVPVGELFSRRRFYWVYDGRDLRRLCNRRTPEGRPLTWTVVRALLRVLDPTEREALEARAADEALSARQLRALLGGRNKDRAAGRKLRRAESPEVALADVAAEARRMVNVLETLVTDENAPLKAGGPGSASGYRRTELAREAEAALRALGSGVARARRSLGEVRRADRSAGGKTRHPPAGAVVRCRKPKRGAS